MVTSVLLSRNLDFVIIDFEHGGFDISTLIQSVFAAKSINKKIYARVSSPSSDLIPQILDADVDGILFAHIHQLSDAQQASDSISFPPIGTRSFTPFSYAFAYNHPSGLSPTTSLGLLIESSSGVSELPMIIEDIRVDFVYFGAYDLSAEFGLPGDIFSSQVLSSLEAVASICADKRIHLWALATKPHEIKILKSYGVDVIIYGVDTGLIADATSFPELR